MKFREYKFDTTWCRLSPNFCDGYMKLKKSNVNHTWTCAKTSKNEHEGTAYNRPTAHSTHQLHNDGYRLS